MELPTLLGSLIDQRRWPRFLDGSGVAPHLRDKGINIELLQANELYNGDASKIADLDTLQLFADNEKASHMYRVRRPSADGANIELPWLDVEKAAVIGGGADYGDDVWLVLDYRSGATDPRVLVNEFVRDENENLRCYWREVAPTFSAFAEILPEPETKPWWKFW